MIEELRKRRLSKRSADGSSPDVDPETSCSSTAAAAGRRQNDTKMQIVINEIMQDKIYLDTEMNVQVAAAEQAGPLDIDFRNL